MKRPCDVLLEPHFRLDLWDNWHLVAFVLIKVDEVAREARAFEFWHFHFDGRGVGLGRC